MVLLVGLGLALVAGAIVAVVLIRNPSSGIGEANEPNGIAEDGAMLGFDFFTQVEPGQGAGPAVDEQVALLAGPRDGMGADIVPGSSRHLATAKTPAGDVNIFAWRAVSLGDPLTCWGDVSASGSSAGCAPSLGPAAAQPQVSHGSNSGGPLNEPAVRLVSIAFAPPEARWLVVETQTGTRIAANVTTGVSYAEWPEVAGIPIRATLFDADLGEVWTSTLNRG